MRGYALQIGDVVMVEPACILNGENVWGVIEVREKGIKKVVK